MVFVSGLCEDNLVGRVYALVEVFRTSHFGAVSLTLMNYFELYGIPVSLRPDPVEIKKKFYALSRQYHPDFFSGAGEAKQEEALQVSADINKAYRIFQDESSVIRYVLQMNGLLEEEEKHKLPAAFLGEVMEINEQLMELEMDGGSDGLERIEAQAAQLKQKINDDVEMVIEHYKEGISPEKELLQVKEYYFKQKYLQRILDKITQMRNIASP